MQFNFDFSESPQLDRHQIVLAYDIPNDRRRRKIARIALSYASRVQRSVFEAHLTDAQARVLARTLQSVVDPSEDDIRLYPQCMRCASLRTMLGLARPTLAPMLIVA